MFTQHCKKFLALSIAMGAFILTFSSAVLAADLEKTIPYPATYNPNLAGASQFIGKMDIDNSPYYPKLDFFNMKSNEHLTILSNYKTYQQSDNITCGPAAALTVLYYFNNTEYAELWLAGQMGTKPKVGTDTAGIAGFFEKIGYRVASSLTAKPFKTVDEFALFTNTLLKNNTPIMVENIDWGGHWRVIIGYDTMGTTTLGDDVLIMADPFDTGDHQQDGYVVVSADKFFSMWFDAEMMPKEQKYQQWIAVRPQK